MNKPYEQSPRFNATGAATGSILALILAMAISIAFDVQPAEASNVAKAAAHKTVALRG
jgi:hypothetical protein